MHCSNSSCSPLPPLLNGFGGSFRSFRGGDTCLSGSSILSGVLARIPAHPSLKIRQQSVLCSANAIITLLRIITYYYVLLRIFLQKSCFMMSFIVFTYYCVLIGVLLLRAIIAYYCVLLLRVNGAPARGWRTVFGVGL